MSKQLNKGTEEFDFEIEKLTVTGKFDFSYMYQSFPRTHESEGEFHAFNFNHYYPDEITYFIEGDEVTVKEANEYYNDYHMTVMFPDLKDWIKNEIDSIVDESFCFNHYTDNR